MFTFNGLAAEKADTKDIKLADELKSKYKKFEVALKSSKSTYEIKCDKNKCLYAVETIEEEYISLVPDISYRSAISYDAFSSIEAFCLLNGKGKNLQFEPLYRNANVDGIFHSDAKMCEYIMNFPLKGLVRKIVATKKYDDLKFLTKSFFQSDLPIAKREIIFKIPSWVSLNLIPFNFDNFDIKKSETLEKDGTKIITYLAGYIAEFPDEEYSAGINYYAPHLLIVPDKTDRKTVSPIINSTANLYNWYKSLLLELSPDKDIIKKKIVEITENSKSDLDKINAIYYWVQSNIRYLAYEQGIMGFKPDEAHEVLAKKYGDCKGMANLLVEMLKCAGYDARMTWIGTNSLCYDYSTPSLAVDNHCIATLFFNGRTYFLDATNSYLPLGLNGEHIQGKQAMIYDGDNYILETVPQGNSSDNKKVQSATLKMDGDILTGDIKMTYTGEASGNLFYQFSTNKNDLHQKIIEVLFTQADNNVAVLKCNNSDLFDINKPFEVNASITVSNKISSYDQEKYLVFEWEKPLKNLQLKSDRKTDLYLGRKLFVEKHFDFVIPFDQNITHVPDKIEIETPLFKFWGEVVRNGNILSYSLILDVKTAFIKKDQFKIWNDAIVKLSEFYDDQVVLTRKN